MNDDKKYYVYEYVDPTTKIPFYIGKGRGDRCFFHLKNLNDNTNPHKTNKIKKLLKEGLTPIINLIKTGLTETQSFEIEKKLIKKYGRFDLGTGCLVNLSDGGEGQSGWVPTEEYKINMSNSTRGSKNGMFGKTHTDETKNKIREKSIGRKLNDFHRNKMSENRMGEKNGFYGKKHTKESIELIRQKKIGKFIGENNFTSKTFTFISPDNEEKIIKGGFTKFCNENKLSVGKMKRNIDKGVIQPPKKNPKSMTIESENCIGWKVKTQKKVENN
jgi:hypothetical protein